MFLYNDTVEGRLQSARVLLFGDKSHLYTPANLKYIIPLKLYTKAQSRVEFLFQERVANQKY